MRKILATIVLAGSLTIAMAQQAKKAGTAVDAVTKATCDCLKKEKDNIKTETDAQKIMSICMMTAAGNRLPDLQKELGIKQMDQAGAMKLGQAVSVKLASDCPAFMDIMMSMQNKITKGEADEVEEEIFEGEVIKVETDAYTLVQIKNPEGKISKFVWFSYFKGSDAFKDNPQLLSGKKVKISWKPVEVYYPAQKDYMQSKEITSLEVK